MNMKSALLAGASLLLAGCATAPVAPEESVPEIVPAPVEPVTPPTFIAIQSDLFGLAGSLSNVWGDVDNDGDLDYAVSMKGGEIRLYLQEDGVFESVGAVYGLPESGPEFRGLALGDYDGDGFLDIYAGATMPDTLSRLYHNIGGGGFVDVAEAAGVTVPGRSARQSSWIDYDLDGDVDLYTSDRIAENKLFQNNGGIFTQVFVGDGPTDARATVGACWFDFNKDGKLDLFLANQSGDTDALWKNEGDKFTDVAPLVGLDSPGRTKEEGGVGCAIGDYDNDGNLDIFMSAYGPNRLCKNNGDGTFTDVSEVAGITAPDHVVGADWGDFDNDGDLDLFVVGYEGPFGEQTPDNMFYVNDGTGVFENVLTLDAPMNAADHGVVWVDYDQDGDLDLSVTDGYGPEGGHFVFRNDMVESQQVQSLEVLVLGPGGLFTQPGAEVRAYDQSGKLLATRMVTTGGGYNSQSAIPVHFGLPAATAVDIEVTYLTSEGRKTERIEDVSLSEWGGKVMTVQASGD
jgi:hypothetical protein